MRERDSATKRGINVAFPFRIPVVLSKGITVLLLRPFSLLKSYNDFIEDASSRFKKEQLPGKLLYELFAFVSL